MTSLAHCILGLTSQTFVHAGAGSANDVVDLPIQREAHSDWPCIYGSSVKGALRARADLLSMDKSLKFCLFGPDTENASDHAGSLLVSDARLLALPVRSLNCHFRRVTCPAILKRLSRDIERGNFSIKLPAVPECTGEEAILPKKPGSNDGEQDLYLEEYRFNIKRLDLKDWVEVLTDIAGESYKKEISETLTIISNDSFRHLCRSAMPIHPHIRINSQSKTVEQGALWYEENLSPDTVLYCLVAAQRSRSREITHDAPALLKRFQEGLFDKPWLQLGGNETTGMGWCHVNLLQEKSK